MTLSSVSFTSSTLMAFTVDTEAPGKLLVGPKKKQPLINIPQHSVPLDKECPKEKVTNHSLTCWVFTGTYLIQDRKYPRSALHSLPVLPGRGDKETPEEVIVQGHKPPRHRDLFPELESTPSALHLATTVLKADLHSGSFIQVDYACISRKHHKV